MFGAADLWVPLQRDIGRGGAAEESQVFDLWKLVQSELGGSNSSRLRRIDLGLLLQPECGAHKSAWQHSFLDLWLALQPELAACAAASRLGGFELRGEVQPKFGGSGLSQGSSFFDLWGDVQSKPRIREAASEFAEIGIWG